MTVITGSSKESSDSQTRGRSKRDRSSSRDSSGLCFPHRKYGVPNFLIGKNKIEKLTQPSVEETFSEVPRFSKRLHVRDRISGKSFLIDTSADISLVPANPKPQRPNSWSFCIADVPHPIIGADLLSHYGLLVDLKRSRLVDSSTNIYTLAVVKDVSVDSIFAVVPG